MLNKFLSLFRKPEPLMSDTEVHQLISAVIDTSQIEGDIAEVGVYRGGSAKVICQIKGTRSLYLFDTFNGLPYSDDIYKKGDKFVGLRGERKLPASAVENSEPLSIVDKYISNNNTVDMYGV